MTLDEFITDNDSKPQSQRLSNVEIAEKYGTSETSVRRHRRKLNHTNSFGLPDGPDDLNDPFFQVPVSAITSRGASIRTPDGSWQKISYSPAKAVLANTYSYQDLRDLFDKPRVERTSQARSKEHNTFVIALSDFQALADDTPMLTTHGWTTHGEIRPGDYVYGRDGLPKKVLSVTGSSVQNLFDVEFDHKVTIRASGNHLWQGQRKYHPKQYAKDCTGPAWEMRDLTWTTREIMEGVTSHLNVNGTPSPTRAFTVNLPDALNFGEQANDLPVDPYILGLWLGNGSSRAPRIYGDARDREGYAKIGTVYSISGRPGTISTRISYTEGDLKSLGVYRNKHIPTEYLFASREQRLALLQGLMDSDGSCTTKGIAEFSNTNYDIARGVVFLLNSLGWKCSAAEYTGRLNGENKKPYLRLSIPTDTSRMSLFRFPRKADRQNVTSKPHVFSRQIQRVTPVGAGSAQCLTVEGGLYLAGRDLVLTHNCGKTDENGGSDELVKRVLSAYDQIEGYLENIRYEQIIIAETGDVLENFTNTTAQAQTNDLSLTDQIRLGQTLIAEGVRRFSHYAKDVVYVAVPSNHAAVRTSVGSKNRANAPDDDFGLLVQENIRAILEGREAYAHVRFVHPEKWEEACTVECADGTVLGVTHGHLAKSSDKMGEWFSKQAFAHRGGLDRADILLHGHFHSFAVRLSGDNHFVVCAPSMDGGSSWFSNSAGEVSPAAILTFEAVNHIAQGWQLWYPEVTDNKEEAE